MKLTKEMIFEKIRKRAPNTYGLIIDAWSIGSVHYYAIFITWSNEKTEAVEEHLIYFGVAEDISGETEFLDELDGLLKKLQLLTADWFDIICLALNALFENNDANTVNLDNFDLSVEFISADNCATNIKLCNDASRYRCTNHVSPTINIVERENS